MLYSSRREVMILEEEPEEDVSGGTGEESPDGLGHLNSVQLAIAGAVALVMVYVSFSAAQFSQLPASQRTLTNFLFPFGSGSTARSLHQQGVEQYRAGQYRGAVESFSRSLERQPANVKGIFLLAGSLARLGRYDQAFAMLSRAETASPDFSRIYIKRAYLRLGLGRFEEARRDAQRYIDQEGVPARNRIYAYLVKLAVVKLDSSRFEESSREVIESARELNLPESSFPMQLLEVLNGDRSLGGFLRDEMTHGERTEARAWGAIRLMVEGQSESARRHAQWVLDKGDEQRYEYDLARSMTSVRGIGSTNR